MMEMHKTSLKTVLGIAASIGVVALTFLLPAPEGLSPEGLRSLGILIASIILWVAQPIPIPITALLAMACMSLFGILKPQEIWQGFISSVIFFVLASFGYTVAVVQTKIPVKLMLSLLSLTKKNSKLMVLAFMSAVYIVSAFISDITTNALFAGIAMSTLIEPSGWKKGDNDGFAKCLMIGVVYASTIGGLATPVGSSLNLLILGMMGSATGASIPFASWMAICVPTSLLLLFIAWLSLVLIFRPAPLNDRIAIELSAKSQELGKFGIAEFKVIAVIGLLFLLWLTNGWTGLDSTVIAVLGLVALFLPGINLLTWEQYAKGVSWLTILLIGGVQSIAAGIQAKGAATWLVSSTIARIATSSFVLIIGSAAILPLLRLLVPVGPAFAAIVFLPLTDLAATFGVSVAIFAIMTAFTSEVCFLLGIDNNAMLSYRYGTFSLVEFFVAGIVPTIGMAAILTTLVPPICNALGL